MPSPASKALVVVAMLALSMVAVSQSWPCGGGGGVVWDPYQPITGGNITSPAEASLHRVNAQVACSVSAPSDLDRRNGVEQADSFNKADAFTWSAVDSRGHAIGSFPNGNTGATVIWQAPEWVPPFSFFYERDGEVILRCTIKDDADIPPGEGGTRDDTDVVRAVTITVFDVTIGKCDNQWLPTKDGTTGISAFITPESVTGTIEFTLYDVSNEPGYCMNAGDETDKDLRFLDYQDGFDISPTKDVATTTTAVNSAGVYVYCLDYGAYGKIKAEATVGGVTRTARCGEDLFVTIPLDEDGNHIADGWEHNEGAAADDAETNPPGDGTAGDGFTRYEEYRGFMAWGNHWRTDPDGAKIVFLCDLSGLGSGDFPATALNVRMIYDTEYDQNRVVNFNRQTPPQSHNQCGMRMVDGGWHDWRYGEVDVVGTPNSTSIAWIYTQKIRWDGPPTQDIVTWDPKDLEMTQRVIGHELGHYVNIEHHAGGTPNCVMRTPATDWNSIPHVYCQDCLGQIRLH